MLDPERCWQALCERDANYDGRFVFAVRSTGIFCRPSCPARRPLRANVQFLSDAPSAAAAGFRPCKRCTPQGASPAEQLDALVSAACELLDNAEQPLTLTELAARIGLSASHLSRAFKARTGLTPYAWVNARRQQRLHAALPEATSVLAAALQAVRGNHRLYVVVGIDLDRIRPRQAAIRRLRKCDAVNKAATEARVLPDHVKLSVGSCRDLRQYRTIANLGAGFRVAAADGKQIGNMERL